jgi:hypothetical protein
MAVRRTTIKYGAAAAVLALVIIAGSALLVSNNFKSSPSTGLGSGQGQLDILLTDPPTVPAGVTGIYVTYSNVAVHVSGAGNQSGWTNVSASGSIDLMKLVNVSTTIAAVTVATGFYNALRFNVSSAAVTYNGKNYTAFVPRAELTVIIPGGIQVGSKNATAAMIDMHPTVVNIGSKSDPEFIVDTSASCFGIPPRAFTKAMGHLGYMMTLKGLSWWTNIQEQYTSNIIITHATLTSSSLSVTVNNTGTENVTISVLSLIPIGYECDIGANVTTPTGQTTSVRMPICFTSSAFFVALDNGTLKLLSSLDSHGFTAQILPGVGGVNVFSGFGYHLVAGQSFTFAYSGPIVFGFSLPKLSPQGVVSGDQYRITVVGQQALAQYVVVAS